MCITQIMINLFLAQIQRITSTCANPEMVAEATKRGLNNMIRVIKSRSVFDERNMVIFTDVKILLAYEDLRVKIYTSKI